MPARQIAETKRNRMAFKDSAKAVVASDVDAARELLRPELPGVIQTVIHGARDRMDRTCLRLYFELMGMVNAQADVTVNFLLQLGVQDQDQASRLLAAALDAERSAEDVDRLESDVLAWLNGRRRSRGLDPLVEPVALGRANGQG